MNNQQKQLKLNAVWHLLYVIDHMCGSHLFDDWYDIDQGDEYLDKILPDWRYDGEEE